jgi:uncharacterized protein (TIGR02246 family)
MGKMARLYATAAAVALVSGLASPRAVAGEATKLPTEVFHEIIQKFSDAEDKGDAQELASLFVEDAILLAPGVEQPIQGEENIQRFLVEHMKHKLENHKIEPTVLMSTGPKTMVDAGVLSGDVPEQNGAPAMHVTGSYLAVGVLRQGRWKLWALSWFRNPPAPAFAGTSTPPQAGASTPNK